MTALLKELAVVAAALLVAVAAVQGLGDRAVLVPPPEMVAEGFVRDLSLERWGSARTHLTEESARRLEPDSLTALTRALEERIGRIEDVRGRPFFATDVAAEAVVETRTALTDLVELRLRLVRERGLWKVARMEGLKGIFGEASAEAQSRPWRTAPPASPGISLTRRRAQAEPLIVRAPWPRPGA